MHHVLWIWSSLQESGAYEVSIWRTCVWAPATDRKHAGHLNSRCSTLHVIPWGYCCLHFIVWLQTKGHFSTTLHNAPGTSVPLDYCIIFLSTSDCNGSAAVCTVFTWRSNPEDVHSAASQKPFAAELKVHFCDMYVVNDISSA